MQCGMRALNIKKSPGRKGTATPNVGKQKCVTIDVVVDILVRKLELVGGDNVFLK
jgi:hypothetical protein